MATLIAGRTEMTTDADPLHSLGRNHRDPGAHRELDRHLDRFRRRLERQRAAGTATEDLLAGVQRLRRELSGRAVSRGAGRLTAIRHAVDSLRGTSSRDTIKAAMTLLCRDFGFSRVMVSTVREDDWLPRYLHGRGATSSSFHGFSVGLPVRFADSEAETALVRGRHGVVVSRPTASARQDYLAAPITVGGAVIGMLHADFPDAPDTTVMDQFDLLEAFAECLAVVYERAVLEEKVSQQRVEVDKLCATMDQLMTQRGPAGAPASDAGSAAVAEPAGVPAAPLELTPREREVMSYVATGATNRDIARCLQISEGTVKSHLKRIAEKFGTTNRAAALAMYLAMDAGVGSGRSR
ncbi:LuxR C-terminal-related transcriptional regulator [Mycobacterium sp. SMC-21]|uniref:LuxR C-terminal-related transcriptional regulator n=1 Tax=unclassified Mycobacterium TaxID=2642494 RepID=UPI003875CA78